MYFLDFLFLFLLFLHAEALAFILFGTSSFSHPVFSFFPFWARAIAFSHVQLSVLVLGLSARSLFGFEAMFCVARVGADAVGRFNVFLGSCLRAPLFPRPLRLFTFEANRRALSPSH